MNNVRVNNIMCGIVGAVAQRDVAQILLSGLQRLEYRGYDSAGMAVIEPETVNIQRLRTTGKVTELAKSLQKIPLRGHTGIGHTRWATHGSPSTINAHPHFSQQQVAIVHNGIIENYITLRDRLQKCGYQFESETDTEVIAHLIHHHAQHGQALLSAIRTTLNELKGAYALAIITTLTPNQLYVARRGSPLVIGLGIGENFIASDPLALLPVTQRFIYLEEGDVAKLDKDNFTLYDQNNQTVTREIHTSESDDHVSTKGKYRHYMHKEIYEQPQAIIDTLANHLHADRIDPHSFGYQAEAIFASVNRVQMVACGTSYHAALVARYWLESIAGIPCQVEVASENRYRHAVIETNTLFVALSQSGETADTLAALRQAKKAGYTATLGICNAPTSSLAREADLIFLTDAGVEIGVAATKTFSTQLVALLLLTVLLAQRHRHAALDQLAHELTQLPRFVHETLKLNLQIKTLAKRLLDKQHALFLGRGNMFPIALEGALKLKEIAYMHAEAYPAGELKHGPLALVDKGMPVIVAVPNDHLVEKLAANIQEVQARGGELYVFSDEHIAWQAHNGATIIKIPAGPNITAPIVYTIPLQLLAYHSAVLKGTDVDQPRNLAKSVTVE